jgi:DNA-directed RNA polymerase specialized sigma24 family protein
MNTQTPEQTNEQRRCAMARAAYGCPPEQIAADLGLTVEAVESVLEQADDAV